MSTAHDLTDTTTTVAHAIDAEGKIVDASSPDARFIVTTDETGKQSTLNGFEHAR